MVRRSHLPTLAASLLALILSAGTVYAQPADPARAEPPRAEPPRAEPPRAEPPRAEPPRAKKPRPPDRRRPLGMRNDERRRPSDDMGKEDAVPPLDTDPFRAPKGKSAPPAATRAANSLPWFVRPSVLFVARFAGGRPYLPQEGFGFGMQAGATLGKSTLRMSLALGYHFYRFARPLDIVVNDPNLTSCTAIRALGIHLVTGSAQAGITLSKVKVWAGLRGGFAHAQLKTPTPTCTTDDGRHSTGALGPELGFGYALRADLHLGVTVAYLHFFSDKVYVAQEGTTHRYFYPILTAGAALSLRF